MRMKMISAAVVGLLMAGSAAAQPLAAPQPVKPAEQPKPTAANSLDAHLAAAPKSNPDIQVAEAKVREAEAGLNKARVTVMQQVVAAHAALHAAKADLASAEAGLKHARELRQAIAAADLQKAELDFERAKAVVVRAPRPIFNWFSVRRQRARPLYGI